MEIRSKRNQKHLIATLLGSIFIFAMGSALLFAFFNIYSNDEIENKTYFMIVFSIISFFVAIDLLYTYFKNSKVILIDREKILITNKYLFWRDIQDISLGGKKGFGFFNYQIEAAKLKFNNGDEYYIFENIYSNGAEIKSFIKNVVIEKNDIITTLKTVSEKELVKEKFQKYAGSPFFSFRGIMLWGLIVFILFLTFSNGNKNLEKMLFLFPICLFWFFLNAYSMDYFEVSKNFLKIKNHFFFWKNDIYRLDEIEELVFETQPKQANMLRVISTDFKTKLYRAGTLKDSVWLEFKDDIEKKNVIVRNESI